MNQFGVIGAFLSTQANKERLIGSRVVDQNNNSRYDGIKDIKDMPLILQEIC